MAPFLAVVRIDLRRGKWKLAVLFLVCWNIREIFQIYGVVIFFKNIIPKIDIAVAAIFLKHIVLIVHDRDVIEFRLSGLGFLGQRLDRVAGKAL
jgi:hypothetical protein